MMRRKKKKEGNSERWLLTYSDLITLLMILFILLYSISNINTEKYKKLSESLGTAFNGSSNGEGGSILQGGGGILNGGNQAIPLEEQSKEETSSDANNDTKEDVLKDTDKETSEDIKNDTAEEEKPPAATPAQAEQTAIEDIKYNIDDIISEYDLGDDVGNIIQEDGLVISFTNNLFFNSGETTLKKNMKDGLNRIAIEMNKIDNPILIKGFTDNVPVKYSIYSSNWQLSAIRAANVVQYLIEEGNVDGTRLSAVGCGENDPVASNATAEGRSQNRRIEIVILYKSSEKDK